MLFRKVAYGSEPVVTQTNAPSAKISEAFVQELWRLYLGRLPTAEQLQALASRLDAGAEPMAYALEVAHCPEATARREQLGAHPALFVPPGHYYSPIVAPGTLPRPLPRSEMLGITLDLDAMERLFHTLVPLLQGLDFPDEAAPDHRYFVNNDMFGIGDATILAALIRHVRPRRVIEVGSGFSSAVLLDTLDRTPDLTTQITFIEPYTDRLRGLLRPADHARVQIIESGVQDVPLDVFTALGAGDILFLDTTHISKTGSDVNFELFEVLPRLAPGVWVHFHDVFPDFEYPESWVFEENRSWNEQYALRAFLQFNDVFRIAYANGAFATQRTAAVRAAAPRILENAGGGLWLQKQ